jgi:L-ribulose-5-phosphate 3-epimerase
MQSLKPLEPGAMFWAERDRLDEIRRLGVRCGQLGLPGSMELTSEAAAAWKRDLDTANFTVITVFAAYTGEDYADIPTVKATVGFIPRETRDARELRTYEVSEFAAGIGVSSIACHIGFVPEDAADPDYVAVRDVVRRICDFAAARGQTFALETGQERAEVLLGFLRDVNRPNVRVNFDPANLILYGTEDPIHALRLLGPHLASVHCKDGDWPPTGVPGALGRERPLGQGSVGMERFIRALAGAGFRGPLNIEREAENQEQRLREMREGVRLIGTLVDGVTRLSN